MTDKILLIALVYMIVSFGFGVVVGKFLKWRNGGR